MIIEATTGWQDYVLIDSGNGKRLERFGPYRIVRPDPQCIWQPRCSLSEWEQVDAIFDKKSDGKDGWIRITDVPQKWLMTYKDISFYAKLSPFKHTGVFPEQHLMWDFISSVIARRVATKQSQTEEITKSKPALPAGREQRAEGKSVRVLNLFGYTGIASLVAAQAGAHVTHVDASYPTIGWAKENQTVSQIDPTAIRWLLDDCLKFAKREVKRGVTYDGIIMDPPVFGHGPTGQRWEFFESFPELIETCTRLLSKDPVFVLINAYAISASSIMLQNVLSDMMTAYSGTVESGELVLQEASGRQLSTGIFARWSSD